MSNAGLYLLCGAVVTVIAAAIGIPAALRADKRAKDRK